ncbi:MAG: hypothetical protein EBS01_16310, partial [Verrucomicrobia bacterium]|nr:hypothetical protein [Verrucomicrobiota bacterium]
AADEVDVHPRSDETPTTEQFLNMKPGTTTVTVGAADVSLPTGRRETKPGVQVTYHWGADFHANVILAYWGFNESFKGEAGLNHFKTALDAYLQKTLEADYGQGHPRVVLLSPIAHENLKDPTNFPDGSANNKNLALYTEAMAGVAKARNVPFVDLFSASQALYSSASKPLTINGIHLTEAGDKLLAPVQFKAIFGKEAPSTDAPRTQKIREAVLEKNLQWHHRYRSVDQYNIFGSRSRIKYAHPDDPANAPDNATIMGHELAQRDVKTLNRDKAVWAAAQGKTYELKDDNLPPVGEVPPNRYGPFPVANKAAAAVNTTQEKPSPKAPLRPYIENGEDTLKYIKSPEGTKVEFIASEKEFPELVNPVQMN